jgi:tetratricopeptide (TPR) repeat protein
VVGSEQVIDPCRFVEAVQPLLARRDAAGLLELLRSSWSPAQIVSLLSCPSCDARKVAALALSLVGGACCIEELSQALRDPDPMVNEMAEHALWSIWFRMGSCDAKAALQRGSDALDNRDLDAAIEHFTQAIQADPNFSEAYNQRALAHYLADRYEQSIEDCQQAVRRMPCHFGAWAGMGHCYAHLSNFAEAVRCYERALEINPHLACIREGLDELRKNTR